MVESSRQLQGHELQETCSQCHVERVSHPSLQGMLLRSSVLLRLFLMLPSVTSNKASLFFLCFSETFPVKPATWALSVLLLIYLFFSQEHAKKIIPFLLLHFSLQKLPHLPKLDQNFRIQNFRIQKLPELLTQVLLCVQWSQDTLQMALVGK